MTLFISILLINGFDMSEWFYPLAFIIWIVHLIYWNE